MDALLAEESMMKQKAKVDWLRQGDLNTAYFHARVKQRRASCSIRSICDSQGNWHDDPEHVKAILLDYFQLLLGSSSSTIASVDTSVIRDGPVLSIAQASSLSSPIQDEEVKQALFSIENSKSPGPDGYSSGFLKSCMADSWGRIHCSSEGFLSYR